MAPPPPANRQPQPVTLWALVLDQRVPAEIAPRVPAIFRRLAPDNAAYLALAFGAAGSVEALRRLREGRRCHVALVGGLPVAHAWVTVHGGEEEIGEVGVRLRLAPRDAYMWDCATALPFRRRLLFTALLTHVAGELHAEGYVRLWIGAGNDNVASRRGIAHAGFQPVAEVVAVAAASGGPDGVQLAKVRGVPGAPKYLVEAAGAALAVVGEREPGLAPVRTLHTARRDDPAT